MNEQPLGWWKARVFYPEEGETINIMAVLTNEPDNYLEGLKNTYEGARIEIWEVDEHGNAVEPSTQAREEREEVREQPKKQEEAKRNKPPSGMAEHFTT